MSIIKHALQTLEKPLKLIIKKGWVFVYFIQKETLLCNLIYYSKRLRENNSEKYLYIWFFLALKLNVKRDIRAVLFILSQSFGTKQ